VTAAIPAGAGVYLLHFDRRYQHAGHYLGYSPNIPARLREHAAGGGARLTQVVKAAGIGWTVARTWPGATRRDERRLKRRGSSRRHCPICKAVVS
jgi:predicted GIY-YIG superfamily endonuclease